MAKSHRKRRRLSLLLWALVPLAGIVLLACFLLIFYRPDRRVAPIVPGSSPGPAFVVQIIRPRIGLPLGGMLPPHFFGLDGHLGFDSKSEGAAIRSVSPRRIEFAADDWNLQLVLNADGQVTADTEVVFDLVFEERVRTVRCRPAEPPVGELTLIALDDSEEISGSFDIELPHCEDAATGDSLGWPPQPFILHGSFDRLSLDTESE